MNDKCAAGTGRFFEAMARSFELSLPEFSKLSLTAKNVIPITAQCTVFAESEVITLVGEGKATDEIAAGIEMAVAKRCFVMAKKAGATDSITLTGGCAKNDGLKEAIEHVLKLKVINLKTDPQLMGALGAKLCKILFSVVALLFVVYFWNLDQKLLGWAYKRVNEMFDQKKVDQVF